MAKKGLTIAQYEITRYTDDGKPFLVRYALREDGAVVRRIGDDTWKRFVKRVKGADNTERVMNCNRYFVEKLGCVRTS